MGRGGVSAHAGVASSKEKILMLPLSLTCGRGSFRLHFVALMLPLGLTCSFEKIGLDFENPSSASLDRHAGEELLDAQSQPPFPSWF